MQKPNSTIELLKEHYGPAVFLNLKQVSKVIGLAEQTIRNLISQGRLTLPTRKVGGKRVVHVLELAQWIDQEHITSEKMMHLSLLRRTRPGRPTKAEQRRR